MVNANSHPGKLGLDRSRDHRVEAVLLKMARLHLQRFVGPGLPKFRLRNRSVLDIPRQHAANANALAVPDVRTGEAVARRSREADGCSSRTWLLPPAVADENAESREQREGKQNFQKAFHSDSNPATYGLLQRTGPPLSGFASDPSRSRRIPTLRVKALDKAALVCCDDDTGACGHDVRATLLPLRTSRTSTLSLCSQ